MKLLLPVTMLVFAAGFCCCGGDSVTQLEQLTSGAPASDAAPVADAGGGAAPAAAGGTVAVAGTCGRFSGLTAPSGSSVMACTTSGDTDSLVLTGGGKPDANCAALKEWAKGAGYSIDTDVAAMGSYAIMGSKDSTQLSIACTDMGGSATSSLSISPKM